MATALGNITQMPKIPGITPQAQPIEPGAVYSQQIEALQPKLEEVRTRAGTAEREKGALASEEKAFGAEQAVKRAEGMAGAQEKFAQTMREAPMRPELEEKVKQEQDFFFQPGQRDGMQLATLASLMMVLGTSIGKGGKGNAMAALSGLNGMMEGYRKRSDELYKQEKGQFESNAKALKDQITALRQAMQDYEKQASVDKQGALQNLEIELARQGADFLKQRVERQGVANLLPELQRQEKQLQTQMDQYNRKLADAQNKAQEAKVRAEEARQRELDRQAFAASMQKERIGAQKELQKERLEDLEKRQQERLSQRGPGAAQITSTRVMQQDVGNAKYNLQDLKSLAEQTGKLPGGSVAFANKFTGDLSSMIQRYAINQVVDEGLQGMDALMLNLAFDIASAQSGGRGQLSDAKVRAVVQQMPLDAQPESTKATKWAALMTRVDEANKSIEDPKKRVEIPDDLRQYFMGTRYAKGSDSATPAAKPASAPENAKQAPDGNWYAPDPNRPGKYIRY